MTTMNISLPDDLKEFVDLKIQSGYSSASEYIRELLRNAQKQAARENLESALLAGLESGPATPLTDKDWKTLRDIAEKRWAKRTDAKKDT